MERNMNWLKRIFRRKRMTADLSEEMRQHLDEKIEAFVAAGMPRQDATHAACRAFGNATLIEQRSREIWMWPLLETLCADIKFSLRQLRKSPGFAITIILMLALAIAATATTFSVVDAVLLHPLPFPHAGRLLMLWEHHPLAGLEGVSHPDYIDWRDQTHVFDGLAAYTERGYTKFNLNVQAGRTEEIEGTLASSNLFTVIGIKPMLGRGFLPNQEIPGHEHVVLLSYRLWQNRFGSNPNIVGQPVVIDNKPYTVIGVLPRRLEFPAWAQVWMPMPTDFSPSRAQHILNVVGRRKAGISITQVKAEMQAIVTRLQLKYPITNKPTGFMLLTLFDHIVGNVRAAIWSLAAAALLVLLMICANVANLLLVRGIAAQKEMAVRSALGASRSRLISQWSSESLLLSACGIVDGLGLAHFLLKMLCSHAGNILPRAQELSLSPTVSLGAACLCLAITVFSGLAPCLQMLRTQAFDPLKQGSKSTVNASQLRVQRNLLRVEAALAMVVLIATGLLLRSFRNLLDVNVGFHTAHILTMQLKLPPDVSSPNQSYRLDADEDVFFPRLLSRLRQIPGVHEVATVDPGPMTRRQTDRFAVADQAMPAEGQFPVTVMRLVSPEYFALMGIHARHGRLFNHADCDYKSVLVNETMEDQYFHGENATGHAILQGFFNPPLRKLPILGVVTNVRDIGLATDAQPTTYWCGYTRSLTLLVRTYLDPMALAVTVQKQIHAFDPDIGIGNVASMDQIVYDSLASRRVSLYLFVIFACLALTITSAGVSAVLSYSLAQRKKELAVRVALGATRADLARLFLYQTLRTVVPGFATGWFVAAIGMRAMASILFRVQADDPAIFLSVPVVLGLVTLLVASWQMHHALTVDPMEALRAE